MATFLAVCFVIWIATLPLRLIQRRNRRRAAQLAALQQAWLRAAQRANSGQPPAKPVPPQQMLGYLGWGTTRKGS